MSRLGFTADLGVVNEDLLKPGEISESKAAVIASISAELELERRWREYVSESSAGALLVAVMKARHFKRRLALAPPWQSTLKPADPGPKMLRRLANIELGHLAVMRKAVESQARWVLILEDDASAPDDERLARQISDFCLAADDSGQPAIMNLSESFTVEQLGIEKLLTPITVVNQPEAWKTFSVTRLVTNTVCAVIYRHDFLTTLVERLDAIPLEPVVPIDFKINAAFMAWPQQEAGQCWVCSPAPIVQRSGVPPTLM